MANTKQKHPDTSLTQNDTDSQVITTAQQTQYPLLKPITFTNMVTDDYLDSGVWQLR